MKASELHDSKRTTGKSAREVVAKLIEAFPRGDFKTTLSLYDENVVLCIPFLLPEKGIVNGRASIARFFKDGLPRMYENIRVEDLTIFETTDPEWVIAEWTYVSQIGEERMVSGNVIIVQVRDGKVIHSRDYHDHVRRAVADGHAPQLADTILGMQLEQDRR